MGAPADVLVEAGVTIYLSTRGIMFIFLFTSFRRECVLVLPSSFINKLFHSSAGTLAELSAGTLAATAGDCDELN